jgi:hypothetical protein
LAFYGASYNAQYVAVGQIIAELGGRALFPVIYQSHHANSYPTKKPAYAIEHFVHDRLPLDFAHPILLLAPKAFVVANAFDVHNTVFAKLFGLGVLAAEGDVGES